MRFSYYMYVSLFCGIQGVRRTHAVVSRVSTALVVIALLSISSITEAQTRFRWPDSRFDVSKYTYFESCVGVNGRVRDSVSSRMDLWEDTAYHSNLVSMQPLAKEVIASTQQCLTHFSADTLPLSLTFTAQRLYLAVSNDSVAKLLVEKKLRSIPAESATTIAMVVDSAIENLVEARPTRLALALETYATIEALGTKVDYERHVIPAQRIATASWAAKDTMRYRLAIEKIVNAAKSLTDEQWAGKPGFQMSLAMWVVLDRYKLRELTAALAKSTVDFRNAKRALFVELVGREPQIAGSVLEFIGSQAPPVYGDFWFPTPASKVTYPRPGKVTIVVSLFSEQESWKGQQSVSAVMRRLAKKYPDLDIVSVVKTVGYFKELPQLKPAEEAVLLDSVFRKFYQLPGVLSVTKGDFWKLPGYDRRRIDQPMQNDDNGYPITKLRSGLGVGAGKATLIDKEGKNVMNTHMGVGFEEQLELYIQALLHRDVSGNR